MVCRGTEAAEDAQTMGKEGEGAGCYRPAAPHSGAMNHRYPWAASTHYDKDCYFCKMNVKSVEKYGVDVEGGKFFVSSYNLDT